MNETVKITSSINELDDLQRLLLGFIAATGEPHGLTILDDESVEVINLETGERSRFAADAARPDGDA